MGFFQNLSLSFDAVFETCLSLIMVRFIYFCFSFFLGGIKEIFSFKVNSVFIVVIFFYIISLTCFCPFFFQFFFFTIFLHFMLK